VKRIFLSYLFAGVLAFPSISSEFVASQDSKPGVGGKIDFKGMNFPQSTPEQLTPALRKYGPIEVLSDTQNVDFGAYLTDVVLPSVRRNWYSAIPESGQRKKGKVEIEFAITRDGKVRGMKLVFPSGDTPLDRAAWAGITGSDPFPHLPAEFQGQYLALRFRFFYNPDKTDLEGTQAGGSSAVIVHAMVMPYETEYHLPKYPKEALKAKTEGLVRLEATVGVDGRAKEVKVVEGDAALAEASSQAVEKWQFVAAEKNGKAVEDRIQITFEFRPHHEVKTAVSYPSAKPHAP
jgi:TonB family protein